PKWAYRTRTWSQRWPKGRSVGSRGTPQGLLLWVMIDPLEAHRQEIWEGLMEAGARGEVEKFRCFNIEWERLNALYPEGEQVVFGGDPVPYTHRDYCGHCHSNWQISGIRFGAFLPGSVLRAHMEVDCP